MEEQEYIIVGQPHVLAGNVDSLSDDDFAQGLLAPLTPMVVELGKALNELNGGGWQVVSHNLTCVESKLVVSFMACRPKRDSASSAGAPGEPRPSTRHIIVVKPVRLDPDGVGRIPVEQFVGEFLRATMPMTQQLPQLVPQVYPTGGQVVSHCVTRIDNRLVISVLLKGE